MAFTEDGRYTQSAHELLAKVDVDFQIAEILGHLILTISVRDAELLLMHAVHRQAEEITRKVAEPQIIS